jgi:putative component of toxin-antitoxin plasmid stabilization module
MYYIEQCDVSMIMLCGGTKDTQSLNIKRARERQHS